MADAFVRPRQLSPRQSIAMIAGWMLALAAGFAILIDHDLRAGGTGNAGPHWPAASSLARSTSGPTLVMFIHPHCPCTAASLEQLGALCQNNPAATLHVVVADVVDGESGDNTALARQIPGAVVQFDRGNTEAQRFGSRTSGTLFIFDDQGRLTFEGGLTAARGHRGENPVSAAALAALQGASGELIRMPAFGCALANDELPAAQ